MSIPIDRVQGLFARENGQGAFFTVESPTALAAAPSTPAIAAVEVDSEPPKPPAAGRARLKVVK